MDLQFDRLLDTAHKLANAAANVTLPHFRMLASTAHKGGAQFDPVTIADRDAESAMRAIILHDFPDHGIVGEEFGTVNEGADIVWVLDPIDGTRAFILGLPLWGTLIGLQHLGVPVLGIMDQPFTGERFWNDEHATWHRGPRGPLIRCRTRSCASLSDAFLTASSPDMFDTETGPSFDRLAKSVRMRRFGGDCYAYCMLALGHIDLVAEAGLKPYDIAPLIPIVEKAGGCVKAWDNGSANAGGSCLACGDPTLLQDALSLLQPDRDDGAPAIVSGK